MVNYSYYREVYYGYKVSEEQVFKNLQGKAKRLVDQHTFNRSKTVKDEDLLDMIKLTICELIDNYADIDNIGTLKSERIDDYNYTNFDRKDIYREQVRIINKNLMQTGLLYAGVYASDYVNRRK